MNRFAVTTGLTISNFIPIKITVEVKQSLGLPMVNVIGSPSQVAKEAKYRVISGIKATGIKLKALKTVINLSPSQVRKSNSSLDLAVALGILIANQQLPALSSDWAMVGEIGLDGQIKPAGGELGLALSAVNLGIKHLIVSTNTQVNWSQIDQLQIYAVSNLTELLSCLTNHGWDFNRLAIKYDSGSWDKSVPTAASDFSLNQIYGQYLAKQAAVISAAGQHHWLLIGPPGVGKTLLAQASHQLLPPLTTLESQEVTTWHSLANLTFTKLIDRPFRAPHHSLSGRQLLGGGIPFQPGEITLAHRGTLFLDELPELKTSHLTGLLQSLETGQHQHSIQQQPQRLPARYRLVACANPCRCGKLNHPDQKCLCTSSQHLQYWQRLSGALLDRIDLYSWVNMIKLKEFQLPQVDELATEIAKIPMAVARQRHRLTTARPFNSQMTNEETHQYCLLDPDAQALWRASQAKFKLSGRGYFKVLKVARTIADLADQDLISPTHLSLALQYRQLPNLYTQTEN